MCGYPTRLTNARKKSFRAKQRGKKPLHRGIFQSGYNLVTDYKLSRPTKVRNLGKKEKVKDV
ncbi:MAG: hypothetical protein ACOX7X_09305 [Methanosarcina flavescens]|uniref:Uncharacterized protein n=1 Tax=Methanosarcina flavescens TaxID=1715806 RepID=A0A7K4ASS8_9EURY|nr:hypothetical protein [Methanosarcina flavescens]